MRGGDDNRITSGPPIICPTPESVVLSDDGGVLPPCMAGDCDDEPSRTASHTEAMPTTATNAPPTAPTRCQRRITSSTPNHRGQATPTLPPTMASPSSGRFEAVPTPKIVNRTPCSGPCNRPATRAALAARAPERPLTVGADALVRRGQLRDRQV